MNYVVLLVRTHFWRKQLYDTFSQVFNTIINTILSGKCWYFFLCFPHQMAQWQCVSLLLTITVTVISQTGTACPTPCVTQVHLFGSVCDCSNVTVIASRLSSLQFSGTHVIL